MSCDSIKSLLGYYNFSNVLMIAILLLFQIMCNFALFHVTSQVVSSASQVTRSVWYSQIVYRQILAALYFKSITNSDIMNNGYYRNFNALNSYIFIRNKQ